MSGQTAQMNIEKKEAFTMIHFTGYLQYGLIEDMKKQLQSEISPATAQNTDYILNMSHVKNIDSTGFGMIVNFAKNISMKQNKIVIIVVDDFVRKLFAISQCDKLFPIVNSEADALKAFADAQQTELSIDEY